MSDKREARKLLTCTLLLVSVVVMLVSNASAKVEKSDAEELLKSTFPLLYKNAELINFEVLPGCGPEHFRGRFHWLMTEDLPVLDREQKISVTYSEVSSLEIPIRYGEFFFRVHEGRKLFTFHGYDFSDYYRQSLYSDLCEKNKTDATAICSKIELNYGKSQKFEKAPLVECLDR